MTKATVLGGMRRVKPVIAAMMVVPMLAACQAPRAPQPTVDDAADDRCAMYRAAFRSTEPTFDDIATNVGLSLAAGAASGLIVGAMTGNTRAGLATGLGVAAVGITATLINANFRQMQGQQRRDALLGQSLAVDKYGERVTGASIALDQLSGCRKEQVMTVKNAVRGNRMTRPEGEAQLARIRGWYADDLTLIRSFDDRLSTDTRQLADSSKYINDGALVTDPPFRPYGGIVATSVTTKQSVAIDAADGSALQPGQVVRVIGREGDWLRVSMPGNRTGFVRPYAIARETTPAEHQGASAQKIRVAAKDEADAVGDVATGGSYRVVGRMTGWLVVDNVGRRSFVRASALRPTRPDDSGNDVVQATASAVSSRNSFSSDTQRLEAEARRVTLDI